MVVKARPHLKVIACCWKPFCEIWWSRSLNYKSIFPPSFMQLWIGPHQLLVWHMQCNVELIVFVTVGMCISTVLVVSPPYYPSLGMECDWMAHFTALPLLCTIVKCKLKNKNRAGLGTRLWYMYMSLIGNIQFCNSYF